jgi:DNA repair photolyase
MEWRKVIDTGYLFSRDDKRIFVNTCLGCTGNCSYCYLSKMGYDNKNIVSKIKKAEELIEEIEHQRNFRKYIDNFRMFFRMLG